MAIAHLNTGTDVATGSFTSRFFAFNVPNANNRILIVAVAARDNAAGATQVSSITFNGIPLTRLLRNTGSFATDGHAEYWYLVNPPVVNALLSVTWSGSVHASLIGAVALSGVDQGAPFDSTKNEVFVFSGSGSKATPINNTDGWIVSFACDDTRSSLGNISSIRMSGSTVNGVEAWALSAAITPTSNILSSCGVYSGPHAITAGQTHIFTETASGTIGGWFQSASLKPAEEGFDGESDLAISVEGDLPVFKEIEGTSSLSISSDLAQLTYPPLDGESSLSFAGSGGELTAAWKLDGEAVPFIFPLATLSQPQALDGESVLDLESEASLSGVVAFFGDSSLAISATANLSALTGVSSLAITVPDAELSELNKAFVSNSHLSLSPIPSEMGVVVSIEGESNLALVPEAALLTPPLLQIGGLEYIKYLREKTVKIKNELNSRDTASFELVDTGGMPRPEVGQEVIMNDFSVRLFGGSIDRIEEFQPLGAESRITVFKVQCVSFDQILDRHLVAKVFDNTLAGDIARDLVTEDLLGEGLSVEFIQDGLEIERAVFNFESVKAAMDDLAKLIGFHFYVDYNKAVHFEARDTFRAPFDITQNNRPVRNLKMKQSRSQYRNRQFVRAGQDISDTLIENFIGDDTRKTFNVQLELAEKPTILLNGAPQSVGIRQVDLDTDFEWFFQVGSNEISQRNQIITGQDQFGNNLTEEDPPIGQTDELQVSYRGRFPILVVNELLDEIDDRKTIEGGTGVYEEIEDNRKIDRLSLARDRANGLLRQKGEIPGVCTYETDVDGLRAGQLQLIDVPEHGFSEDFLITRVSVKDIEPKEEDNTRLSKRFRYSVEAISTEFQGGWQEFFKALFAAGQTFSLRENEVIQDLRKPTDFVEVVETVTPVTNTLLEDPGLTEWWEDPFSIMIVGTSEIGTRVGTPEPPLKVFP